MARNNVLKGEQLWKNMHVLVVTFMIPKSEIPTEVSLPELLLKIFPLIGYAPYADWEKILSRKHKTKIRESASDSMRFIICINDYI